MDASDDSPLIPITEVGHHIPGRPSPASRATVWRWIVYGVSGHRLKSTLIAGRRYVSRQAIQRWLQSINADDSIA